MVVQRILDFFRGNPSSPHQIDRLVKRLTETGGEDGPRIEAAQKLAEIGTPEAMYALLKRFTISSKVITQDIEEKRMVVEFLVDKGTDAVEPILRFLKQYHQVEWPVQALTKILPQEEWVPQLVDVLQNVAQNPFTSPEHRSSLIKAMQGHVTSEIAATLKKSLKDDDDDVRIAAIQAMAEVGEEIRELLLESFIEASDRPRIRIAVAELFADHDWPVKGFRPTIEQALPDGFYVTAKGMIRRKGSAA
jgi:HEAT repeat protein